MADTSVKQFLETSRKAKRQQVEGAATTGPRYHANGSAASLWHDQIFGRDILCSGARELETALRVGSNAQGLYVALNASAGNEGVLEFPAGSTITFTFLQGDDPDGEFAEVGPTVCMKAPAEGIEAEPGDTICRVALGNFSQPWLKLKIEFDGSVEGGTAICGLGYAAR